MSEKSTLKPCPFCGIKAEINDISKTIVDDRVCGCWADNIFLTKEDWNTRPLEDALRAERDAAMKARREAEGMVERLIEAGNYMPLDWGSNECIKAITEWNALVAEWEQR